MVVEARFWGFGFWVWVVHGFFLGLGFRNKGLGFRVVEHAGLCVKLE